MCSEVMYFNGSKLQHQCLGLGPMVLQGLLSFCHGNAKERSWPLYSQAAADTVYHHIQAVTYTITRAEKFTPVPDRLGSVV